MGGRVRLQAPELMKMELSETEKHLSSRISHLERSVRRMSVLVVNPTIEEKKDWRLCIVDQFASMGIPSSHTDQLGHVEPVGKVPRDGRPRRLRVVCHEGMRYLLFGAAFRKEIDKLNQGKPSGTKFGVFSDEALEQRENARQSRFLKWYMEKDLTLLKKEFPQCTGVQTTRNHNKTGIQIKEGGGQGKFLGLDVISTLLRKNQEELQTEYNEYVKLKGLHLGDGMEVPVPDDRRVGKFLKRGADDEGVGAPPSSKPCINAVVEES